MEIHIPIFNELSFRITDTPEEQAIYPTSRIRKGLKMSCGGLDLSEEAVGFGLPVLKRGLQTFFPGDLELDLWHEDSTWKVTALYKINLVEKIATSETSSINNKFLYAAKNSLADIIRHFRFTRGFLTAISSTLRYMFRWKTTYESEGLSIPVKMTFTFDKLTQELVINADMVGLSQDGITEVIIMNEQGAHFFEQYRDSRGVSLLGNEIGFWDEIAAEEASFVSSSQHVAFTLPQMQGARLFRGRELIGSRLAWAGFGYSFPPTIAKFSYTVKIEQLP